MSTNTMELGSSSFLGKENKYRISEIFFSFQGEGLYTGYPAVFIRFFGCNLQCNFGGKTEAQSIDNLEDFVVPERGCDSGYAWMKEMAHLAKEMTVEEIVDEVIRLSPQDSNNDLAIVYTGGEPMLHQDAIRAIQDSLWIRPELEVRNLIHIIETNGTVHADEETNARRFHYSISPKLRSVSLQNNGINFSALSSLICDQHEMDFILKFVLDDNVASWNELEDIMEDLECKMFDFIRNYAYIMPMGATSAQQQDESVERICLRAIRLGYKVSLRTHVYVFANKVGR